MSRVCSSTRRSFRGSGLRALLAGALSATLAGCGSSQVLDTDAPLIREARAGAILKMTRAVNKTVGPLHVHGTARKHSCESGQDNWKVRDDYRWRCGFGYLIAASLPGRDLDEAVAVAVRTAMQAGCLRLADQSSGPNSPSAPPDPTPSPRRYGARVEMGCKLDGVQIDMYIVVADQAIARSIYPLPPGPAGMKVEEQPLDVPGTIESAIRAGDRYLIVAYAAADYYREPA